MERESEFSKRSASFKLLLLLAIIAAFIGYWNGWYLTILSELALGFSASPGVFILALVALLSLLLLSYWGVKRQNSVPIYFGICIFLIIVIALIPLTNVIAKSVVAEGIKVVYLKRIPELYGVYRLLPLPTAYARALDKISVPTHTIYFDESYLYYIGTRPIYNWIIEPEGFFNEISREPIGAVFVYGDVYPPVVKVVKQRLYWGLHNVRLTWVADTLGFELTLHGAFGKEIVWDDVADVLYKGKILQIIPIVKYSMRFPGALPLIEKYAVLYPNGTIINVPPEYVRRFHVPVLPERVARLWVECLRLRNWIQAVVYHNTFVIRDIGYNPQPYLVPDSKGNLWWVFVAEPPGNTYSAYMILLVNAMSTKPVVYVYKFKRPEIGISKVRSYVMKAHPNWAWNEFLVQEPMPSYINGTLMWKVAVTTQDSRGLVSVDFLNASSGSVFSFPIKRRITAAELLEELKRVNASKGSEGFTLESLLKKIEELKRQIEELERMVREMMREVK